MRQKIRIGIITIGFIAGGVQPWGNPLGQEVEMRREEKIRLVGIGEVDESLLIQLAGSIEGIFDVSVEIGQLLPEPVYAYVPERKQYHSTRILDEIIRQGNRKQKVLGVADVDLFVPRLNFVFGEADLHNRAAVISLVRLRQSYYGLPENKKLFSQRTVKEAVHELGHTFGLGHCPNPGCVMFFSNSLADTDRKEDAFCPQCRRRLAKGGFNR